MVFLIICESTHWPCSITLSRCSGIGLLFSLLVNVADTNPMFDVTVWHSTLQTTSYQPFPLLKASSNPTNTAPPIGNLFLAILPWCEDVLDCQRPQQSVFWTPWCTGAQMRCPLLLSGSTLECSVMTACTYLQKASHSLIHILARFFKVPPSARCTATH